MATLNNQLASSPPRDGWAVRGGARARAAIVAVSLVTAVSGGMLLATSDHLAKPVAYGLQMGITLLGAGLAAAVWLKRRPGNRVASYLLAYALAVAIVALQGTSNELLHSLGVLVEPAFFLLGYIIVFAFPAGRPIGVPERLILAGMSLYFLVGFVPWIFFSPVVQGGGPLAGCTEACPPNALMIADRPEVAASLGTDLAWAVIALLTATLVVLAVRLIQASGPRRRTLLPVYVIALFFTLPALAFHGFAAGVLQLDADTLSNLGWMLAVARASLAFGLLLAIVQAGLFAGGALKRLIEQIGEYPRAQELRAVVADALDDGSVELVFRLERDDGFVDSAGRPVASASAPDRRATSPVDARGRTVAAIWHDPALNTDPELVHAVCTAVLLALEHGRLESELAATHARIVAAGDAERRKVERDLHDGAQQSLVAVQIKLAMAQDLVPSDSEIAERLAEVEYGLEDAVEELRGLARGIHPPMLRDFGLREALASVTARSGPPTALIADGIARYPKDVETAVYFCCLESLQNIVKHAGADARAQVRVSESADELCFEIVDDGVGFEVESEQSAGTGVVNMAERVAALRGSLTIDSANGRGTHVRGRIPLHA